MKSKISYPPWTCMPCFGPWWASGGKEGVADDGGGRGGVDTCVCVSVGFLSFLSLPLRLLKQRM